MVEPASFKELDILIRAVVDAETTNFIELANILGLDIKRDFIGADLSGVDLSNCDVSFADFTNTNLKGADLTYANLQGATLANANLSFANLSFAMNISSVYGLSEARFEQTIMIGCKGLSLLDLAYLRDQGAIVEQNHDSPSIDYLQQLETETQELSSGEREIIAETKERESLSQSSGRSQNLTVIYSQPLVTGVYSQQLAIEAQKSPPASRDRLNALTKLVQTLEQSNQLARPRRSQFQGFDEDIYREALQRLFIYICDRIDDYDSARGTVLQWVNFLLTRRFFIEASREVLPTVPKGLDARTITKIEVGELDRIVVEDESAQFSSLAAEVRCYIEADPNQLFKRTHLPSYPSANFQYIALKRLEGYSWQELSDELNRPISTISSFYQRCIEQFAAQIYEDLS